MYIPVFNNYTNVGARAHARARVCVCVWPPMSTRVSVNFSSLYLLLLSLCFASLQKCSKYKPVMSFSLEQWIKRIPALSDGDITNLQQALDKEKCQRRDRRIFQLFRKKCIPAGQECDEDEISDFSEESPGEFAGSISQGIHKLMHTLQGCQESLIRNAFQTWKSAKRSRTFAVSLKRPTSCITID